jgi:copper(I)-binding protein
MRSVFHSASRLSVIALLAVALSGPVAARHGAWAADISIRNAWAAATPPKATVGHGYMTIVNSSAEPDHLLAATADVSRTAEIDGLRRADSSPHMEQLLNLDVPAGGSIDLQPGSYHVLLRNLKTPLKPGETFRGTLTFARSGVISVEYKVEGKDHAAPTTE